MNSIDDIMKQVQEDIEKYFLEEEHKNISVEISHYSRPFEMKDYMAVRVTENLATDHIVAYGSICSELPCNIMGGKPREQLEFIGKNAIEATYSLMSDKDKKEKQKQKHINEIRSCASEWDV